MQVIETGLTVAAVVLTVALGWSVLVYVFPYRKCRWCQVFASLGMRCRRCSGTKLSPRLGARLVHKVRLSLQQAWDER